MIRDICRFIRIAFQPISKSAPPKYVRKTVRSGSGELHINIKTHLSPSKRPYTKK